jgi:hypothetical protein
MGEHPPQESFAGIGPRRVPDRGLVAGRFQTGAAAALRAA